MKKKLTLLFAIATVSSTIIVAQSFTAVYTFDSVKTTTGLTDPTAVPTATGVTFGSFSATGTAANPNSAGRFSFTGWPIGATTGNDLYSSLTGTINTTKYYEVTLTPASGFTMSLSSITFNARRSGTGIRTYAVRSNADAYAANLTASVSPASIKLNVQTGDVFFWALDSVTSGQNGSTITLSGANFTNTGSAKTFRFYGYNAESTGGTFSIDTVKFTGSVTAGTTSVTDLSLATSVSVYPNPSVNGVFTVSLGGTSNKTTITVFNILGEVVFSKEVNSVPQQIVDLSNESNGCYFVNIKNDFSTITRKITVNK